ncbi:MAG: chromate efflux transporter [Bacilli bacterium]
MVILKSLFTIFWTSFSLGMRAFGGPIAHLGYFHTEYVTRKKWISEENYASIVALCQFLPGPASSQVGMAIGWFRGGVIGSIVAWLGFTLPSALFLIGAAQLLTNTDGGAPLWVHGLKLVAVVVVIHAIQGMSRSLLDDHFKKIVFLLSTLTLFLIPDSLTQVVVMLLASGAAILYYRNTDVPISSSALPFSSSNKRLVIVSILLFFLFFIGLPIIHLLYPNVWTFSASEMFRTGSLVFGGGHVVLPLLETSFVSNDLLTEAQFLAGYGLTQAVPGPLFTFASYIGTVLGGVTGGLWSLFWMFLPSFFFVFMALPYWHSLQRIPNFKRALWGVNAAVVGILFVALYDPIITSSVNSALDVFLVLTGWMCLTVWKWQPWRVVFAVGVIGGIIPYIV